MRISDALLYAILDLGYVDYNKAMAVCSDLLDGGVGMLQLRAKSFLPERLTPLAQDLAQACSERQVPFIVNDFPELAGEVGADGIHVGQDDLPVARAREISGCRIVGKSTHSVEQARAAMGEAPDYIGFGPLFSTPTKPDYIPVGLQGIRQVNDLSSVPVFCIGGIKPDNLSEVVAFGAERVVIVSGLLQAQDIAGTCRQCLALLK